MADRPGVTMRYTGALTRRGWLCGTLLGTLVIAASISLILSLHAVVRHMLRFPETLGLIMAVQLLIGRYTGYRLSELLRFREFAVE